MRVAGDARARRAGCWRPEGARRSGLEDGGRRRGGRGGGRGGGNIRGGFGGRGGGRMDSHATSGRGAGSARGGPAGRGRGGRGRGGTSPSSYTEMWYVLYPILLSVVNRYTFLPNAFLSSGEIS